MREILYRGKRVDNGEWVEEYLVMVYDKENQLYYPCIVISYNHDAFDWHDVTPETVGQFTGLCDKNGNKIFEGDILTNNLNKIGVVVYYNGSFCLKVAKKNCDECQILNDGFLKNKEVIGNIHDNPELLNQ